MALLFFQKTIFTPLYGLNCLNLLNVDTYIKRCYNVLQDNMMT